MQERNGAACDDCHSNFQNLNLADMQMTRKQIEAKHGKECLASRKSVEKCGDGRKSLNNQKYCDQYEVAVNAEQREQCQSKGPNGAEQADEGMDSLEKRKQHIQLFSPLNFTYSKLLGEGAFGKVRMCNYAQRTLPKEKVDVGEFGTAGERFVDAQQESKKKTKGKAPKSAASAENSGNSDQASKTNYCSSSQEQDDSQEQKVYEKPWMRYADQKFHKAAMPSQDKHMAVKLQSKYQLITNKQVPHLFNEIKWMGQLDHPFILKLNGISQDQRIMYMYIDYIKAGDLMKVLNKFKKLEPGHAMFYAAQIVLCLEYLHGKNLVFRDLKPENVLVDSNGYLKLADFGFIKEVKPSERTWTFCGTPEYIAPEIIMNKGYSQPVDWYSLGIFIYELMYGRPPFMASDPMQIFQQVLKEKIKFPKDFDKSAKSLIKKLCQHDLSLRYGNLKDGVKDIKDHRFFKDLDWSQLLDKRWQAAHIPQYPEQSEQFEQQPKTEHKDLAEQNDNVKFPPIKDTKDAFLKWF